MGDINERLDRLKLKIQTEDFLWGKGLSNEVNIWIFCYEPTEEMTVHNFVEGLIVEQNLKCRVHSFNLYEVFLDICRKKNILSKIPAMSHPDKYFNSQIILGSLSTKITLLHSVFSPTVAPPQNKSTITSIFLGK